jgi:hypothetical protein
MIPPLSGHFTNANDNSASVIIANDNSALGASVAA